jgi:hypothetical protein
MAIKFVDIEPEGEGKPKRSEKVTAPQAKVDVPAAERSGVSPLPYAKAAPKKWGRN